MATNNQIISKGIYNLPQTVGYVAVKQFIFTRIMDKKHLMLRFSNDLSVAINEIAFTVVQIDAEGNSVGTIKVKHKCKVNSGESFAPDKAFAVDEKCVDVRVTVDLVRSGDFEYSVRDGIVIAHYREVITKRKALRAESYITAPTTKSTKKERRSKGKMMRAAAIAISLIILVNVFCYLLPIIKPIVEEKFFNNKKKNEKPEITEKADQTTNEYYYGGITYSTAYVETMNPIYTKVG